MATKRARSLVLAATVCVSAFSACSDTDELFPSNGTLSMSLVDTAITRQDVESPGNQAMVWQLEVAEAGVDNETFDFIADPPCVHAQVFPTEGPLPLQCDVPGYVVGTGAALSAAVRLTVSRMEVRRAMGISLPDGGDRDRDGVVNEDDNCPLIPNPDQANINAGTNPGQDDVGDACSLEDALGLPTIPDQDGDKVADVVDNCLWIPNEGQEDGVFPDDMLQGGDGIGDICESRAEVVIPGGGLELVLGPEALTPASRKRNYLQIDFNDNLTLSCDDAFTTCAIDPSAVTLKPV